MMLKSMLALASVLASASVASAKQSNGTSSVQADSGYWYAAMDHTGDARGRAPFVDDPDNYPVFKAVEAGADADAIQDAIDTGDRHKQWLSSEPRVVYIPPGEYEIGKTINLRTDTILMGDATDPPTLKAASGFDGTTLLNGRDPTVGESGEISFAVGVKNIILDTTAIDGGQEFVGLDWGVAQVCQLSHITVKMSDAPENADKGHSGIRLQRGSTLGLADIRVEKGLNGILHDGHQQAFYKSVSFFQNTVGMMITGGNTITLLNSTFDTVGSAVKATGGSPFVGIIDTKSINSGTTFQAGDGVYPSVLVDNLDKDTDSDTVIMSDGTALGKVTHVDTFTYGNTYQLEGTYGADNSSAPRPEAVAPGGRIPAVAAPNYADKTTDDIVNIKDSKSNGGQTIKGDGQNDEVDAIQKALQYAVDNDKIAYFPFGYYRVESTLIVPIGSRIIGEGWATIAGGGDFFSNADDPKPVVQVGKDGDEGVAQITDMRVTVTDVLPGAILVQFQAAGKTPGDVGMWNSVITVGGTRGADDLGSKCGDAANECQAAYLGLHFTKSSSAYVENVWNWVADHDTEEQANGGANIAGKGGALVQATKGTWLHALGSEHWWLYQLNLHEAQNVVVGFLQSETNYDQGSKAQQIVPDPWKLDTDVWGDPDFSACEAGDGNCRMGYSNFINGGSDVYYYGSASWVFFDGHGDCDGDYACQKYIHWIQTTPKNFQGYGFCSKSTEVALHIEDGDPKDLNANDGYSGSWSPGGLVGRCTPDQKPS